MFNFIVVMVSLVLIGWRKGKVWANATSQDFKMEGLLTAVSS